MHLAAAVSFSSQLLHSMGFLSCARTAATSIMVVTTKFGGKAPTPRSCGKKNNDGKSKILFFFVMSEWTDV